MNFENCSPYRFLLVHNRFIQNILLGARLKPFDWLASSKKERTSILIVFCLKLDNFIELVEFDGQTKAQNSLK